LKTHLLDESTSNTTFEQPFLLRLLEPVHIVAQKHVKILIKVQSGTRKRIDGQGDGFVAYLSLNRGTILLKSGAREGTKKSLSANIPFGVIRRGDDIL